MDFYQKQQTVTQHRIFTPTPICIDQENFKFASKAVSARPLFANHSANRCGGYIHYYTKI
jgi:hypothetical protein